MWLREVRFEPLIAAYAFFFFYQAPHSSSELLLVLAFFLVEEFALARTELSLLLDLVFAGAVEAVVGVNRP